MQRSLPVKLVVKAANLGFYRVLSGSVRFSIRRSSLGFLASKPARTPAS